jgi:hypothetical protein
MEVDGAQKPAEPTAHGAEPQAQQQGAEQPKQDALPANEAAAYSDAALDTLVQWSTGTSEGVRSMHLPADLRL